MTTMMGWDGMGWGGCEEGGRGFTESNVVEVGCQGRARGGATGMERSGTRRSGKDLMVEST